MQVSELMSRGVITIGPSESCHEAVARMHRAKVRHLPVVADDGALDGMVTDRDVRHHLFAPGVFDRIGHVSVADVLKGIPVKAIMSAPVVAVDAADDLALAAGVMRRERIGALPVLDRGRVVGIITETDMLRQLVRADAWCALTEDIIVPFP
jgi:CBS domain-containing protein